MRNACLDGMKRACMPDGTTIQEWCAVRTEFATREAEATLRAEQEAEASESESLTTHYTSASIQVIFSRFPAILGIGTWDR